MAAKTDMQKQGVFVYSKLQSFEKASNAVQKLLKNVCESMKNTSIDVEPYNENYKLEDYVGVTVVVVIDSQQTRTVITPVRRDSNVDHWDDLKMLSSSRTSPPGSVLIVIYGDESSKDVKDLLAAKWSQVWQYNDPRSYRSVKNNNIFSIFDEFNETQKESIQHHLRMVPLVPNITGKEMNILLLSQQTERDKIKKFLDDNPFVVQQTVEKCSNCQAITFSSYIPLKDLFSEQASAVCLKVHYRDSPIINLFAEKSIEGFLKKLLAQKKLDSQGCKSPECRSFQPVYDRLIYTRTARESFQTSSQTQFRPEVELLKNELENFNLRLRGEAFSITMGESKTTDETTENNNWRCSIIQFLKRQSKESLADQRLKTLQGIDDDLVCRSHAYHLMQSPTLLEQNLLLVKNERDYLIKEKNTLDGDIKLWKTKLRIKEAQASDIDKKLTGKEEGVGRWPWSFLFSKK